ncbi:hypothetical protein ABMA27_005807 [Loxostege sticticalis]|uniref:Endonuclease/exonuclease/phosphatase domain-containing protein n=1 Tax=Loxostege sticticalis TaxID=481309 RepID=A0ABR3HGK0_LOXSC
MMANLNIYYQNARGLRTKTTTFKRNVCLNDYDVISITETWLLEGIKDQELFDDRYVVWRRDRDYKATKQSLGGGVLLAVRRDLAAAARPEWHSSAEDLWVSVSIRHGGGKALIHFCTLYLCNENVGNRIWARLDGFTDKLFEITSSCPDDLFVSQINFFDTLAQSDLWQRTPVCNRNGKWLDLVFSNSNLSINPCEDPLVPDDIPHHRSICLELSLVSANTLEINKSLWRPLSMVHSGTTWFFKITFHSV